MLSGNDCTFVLFGATGDLARKKIFPALFHLLEKNKLGNSIIIGAAREAVTKEVLLERVKPFITNFNEQTWKLLTDRVFYFPINFEQEGDFEKLHTFVQACEKKSNLSGNRLFYCATAAYFFCTITKNLSESSLARRVGKKEKIWNRIVYEKPFGNDVQTAQEINTCIDTYYDEHQIFRIDHYLTKELVANIALVRFTNCVFEPLWNNRYIDHIQIILNEKVGMEGRGGYYDKYGALADVMQNHMMELLALVTMEAPEKLVGEYIRTQRALVLQKVKVVDALLGQYAGYTQEENIPADSKTETFAAAYLRIDNPRWAGVPFYLKTGKCLDNKETMIYIKFKQVDCLLAASCPSESNSLTIEISPQSRFALTLNAKKPGKSDAVQQVQMEICADTFFAPHMPEAYEMLLEEIIRGDQAAVSVRSDEIEYAWRAIDAIRALHLPLYTYEKNSKGPKEIQTNFERKHGMRWHV